MTRFSLLSFLCAASFFGVATALCAATPALAQTESIPSPTEKVVTETERVEEFQPHSPSTLNLPVTSPKTFRTTSTSIGTVGLLNIGSADLGQTGLLRFSVTASHFESNSFPVLNARDSRTAGVFAVGFTPLPWLETYLSYAAATNNNTSSSPNLIQALGDLTLGVKLTHAFTKGVWGAVDLRGQTFSAVGNASVTRSAFGFAPRLLGTVDLRQYQRNLPLRIHANVGFALDSTGHLVSTYGLNAAETYALGMNQYNRFLAGAGVEAPLPFATPFAEYGLQLPVGTNGTSITPDGRMVPLARALPQLVSVGAKVTAIADLTLMAALNIGLTREVGAGIPATEPLGFSVGAAFNVDPFSRREMKVVERVKVRQVTVAEAPKKKRIGGTVLDARTQKPVDGVIVSVADSGLLPVATEASTGRFLTHEVPFGRVKLSVSKDGFRPVEQEVSVGPSEEPEVQIALEPLPRPAHFLVQVSGKKKPLLAKVNFRGTKEQELSTEEVTQPAKLEMPAGKYTVEVAAAGYLAQTREVQVSEASEMGLAFDLQPEPKKKLVVVKENKIQILQQVHFATAKATILPDSYNLLDQVVDAIVKTNIKRLRVEGHTDNRGLIKTNLRLSEERARAVGDYLVKAGIDESRVETAGHGDSKPVAPNLTARGRELNRRVEFVILER